MLLGATVLLAAGALFVKYQLETLRAAVQAEAEARVGGRLEVGAVTVNGLRGLRVDDFHLSLDGSKGPAVDLAIPTAYIDVDVIDLLHGAVTIDRVEVNGAQVAVAPPEDGVWFRGGGKKIAWRVDALPLPSSFRVLGGDCSVSVADVVGGVDLDIAGLHFDVSRLEGAAEL